MLGKIVVDALDLTVDLQSAVAFLDVHLKLFAQRAVAVHHEGRQQHELGAWLLSGHAMCHILDGMFLHLHATDWRYGTSNLCIQQPQVVVNFGRGADCGSWVAADDLLFDGDGRWNALDVVAFGLSHTAEELSCIA